MGTHAIIANVQSDGSIDTAWVRFDGDIKALGKTLLQDYRSDVRVADILRVGNLESIDGWGLQPLRGTAHFTRHYQSVSNLVADTWAKDTAEYIYIYWGHGHWQVITYGKKRPRPLVEAVFPRLRRPATPHSLTHLRKCPQMRLTITNLCSERGYNLDSVGEGFVVEGVGGAIVNLKSLAARLLRVEFAAKGRHWRIIIFMCDKDWYVCRFTSNSSAIGLEVAAAALHQSTIVTDKHIVACEPLLQMAITQIVEKRLVWEVEQLLAFTAPPVANKGRTPCLTLSVT